MSLLSYFGVESPTLEEQARLKEMADSELQYNIQMLEDARLREPPCETFYRFKKEITLSTFLQVYTFDELVDCKFQLPELRELIRLYSTLSPSDQERYANSFRRLRQIMQSFADADQEVREIAQRPEPSNYKIEQIRRQQYLAENPSPQPPSPQPPQPPQPQPPQPQQQKKTSFFDFFKGGKSKKSSKKISRRQKRSKSRSKKSRSKKSRSKSRSKK